MTTYGAKNQPLVATTDPFSPPTDINASTNWSATFAMVRSVANAAARNALAGANLWAGLTVHQADTNEYYSYSGSAWLLDAGVGTPPRIEMTRTSTQTSATATATTQTGWTVTANRGGFTEASGVVTVPRAGKYNIFTQCSWASNSTGVRQATILIGGTAAYRTSTMAISTSSTETNLQVVAHQVPVAGSGTIALSALQASGGALNTTGATVPMKLIIEWAGE